MSRKVGKLYSHICKKDSVEPSSSVQLAFQRMQDSLDLSTVYMTVEQCRVISQTLGKHPVSDLCLSDCLTGDQGLSVLVENLHQIISINLKGNELLQSGVQLGNFLKTNTTLTHLNLEWNSLGAADSSLAALFEGIAINHSLVYLNLSNNQISHIGTQFIASALITNETLVELDLRWNQIGIPGGRTLLSSLKINSCLEELHVTGNNITDDIMEAIEMTLSVKSKHYHAEKQWVTHKQLMQSQSKLKEEENLFRVSQLHEQLDEMRFSSLNITQRAHEEITSCKAELESCYARITHLEDQLLTAKGAIESVEDKYTGLHECHQLMTEEHSAKQANFNAEINMKDQEICSLKQKLKKSENDVLEIQHNLQQKIKLLEMDKQSMEQELISTVQEFKQMKESKTVKIQQLEAELKSQYKKEFERLQQARDNYDHELKDYQDKWEKERSLLKEQLQMSALRIKNIQQVQYKTKSNEEIEKLKQEFQKEQSNTTLKLNHKATELQQKWESTKLQLSESSVKIKEIQLQKESVDDQLKRKDVQHCEAMKIIDEQQAKILAMMSKHSQENEELRQQRNHLEKISEELQEKLHKLKEESHRLKVQLEDRVNKKEEENAELKMDIQTTKKELRNFKEQETQRAKQLKTALETYISGVGLS